VEKENLERGAYEAPVVVDYGDLRDLTAGSSTGDFTDQAFPAGTPFKTLTFSTTP
jgi:hypothetical protein